MAQIDTLLHSLSGAGEVSVDALARVDQQKLGLAAQVHENLLPFVIGKAMMRPGTQYLGQSNGNARARGIPFARQVSITGQLELTDSILRIWEGDTLLTRAAVTSTVTNGDFSSGTGWTLTTTGGGSAVINSGGAPGQLTLTQVNRGGTALCKRSVTTSSTGIQHALRIVVVYGPVFFRCGSADGLDDYVSATILDTGYHSLAFTPSGTYYVEFQAVSDRNAFVDSITVEAAGVVTFPAPWVLAELRQIQFVESVDVAYLAHINWQTRKVERRGTGSWSLAKFYTSDGPFALQSAIDATTLITPSQAYGNITLTASKGAFAATDVGSLIKTTAGGFTSTFALGATGVFGEPARIFGIAPDTAFTITITGTWVGTLTLYRSITGPTAGYQSAGITYTTNQAGTALTPGATFDNVQQWYRFGFSAYTSGVANVTISTGVSSSDGGQLFAAPSAGAGPAGVDGIYRITAYASPTSVSAEVLQNPSSLSGTTNWQRGAWSDRFGWPSAVTFHDGRLNLDRDDRPALSVSDGYTSFATELADASGVLSVTDNASIQRNISTSGAINKINAALSLQRLILLTESAEISARSSSFDQPLTPTTTSFKACSTVGSAPVSPVVFDKQAFYVNRSGDKVYKLSYAFEQQDYDSDDMTELNEFIGNGGRDASFAYTIVELAVQRHPQPYLWAIRSDGQALIMLFSPKQQIASWFRYVPAGDGVIESVYVLPATTSNDRVYFWVKRTVNGSTVRYLEKLCLNSEAVGLTTNKQLDAGLFFAGPASTVACPHLAGATVYAWGNGIQLGSFTADGSGNVALGVSATNIWVGLGYTGRYQSAKLAYGARNGTALLKEKIVDQLGLLASNILPSGVSYGSDFDHLYPLPAPGDGTDVGATTVVQSVLDESGFPFDGAWSTDSRVCLTVAANTPATLNALVVSLKTNEG